MRNALRYLPVVAAILFAITAGYLIGARDHARATHQAAPAN
jgi:hypothetical protein